MKLTLATVAAIAVVSAAPRAFADDRNPAADPHVESGGTQVGAAHSEEAPKVMKRRSTGMFVSGIVLSSLGALSVGFGAAYFAMEDTTDASLQSAHDTCEEANVILIETGSTPNDCGSGPGAHDPWPGVAFLIGGVVGLAAGVPLAAVGGQKVPVTITSAAIGGQKVPVTITSAAIAPVPGGAVVGVRGTF